MPIEDAIISGVIQGGSFGIVSIFLLKYVMIKLDAISQDTTAIITCLKLKKKK